MRVDIGGIRLFFDVAGEKLVPVGPEMIVRPTLLLLHGGPGFDHAAFKPGFSQLADTCQVVFLDQRGNGRSDRGEAGDWRFDRWADDISAFCDTLEIDKPILLGQSFGGMVALRTAIRHPRLAAKLIVSSSTARIRLDRALPAFERVGGSEAREVAARYFADPSDEHFDNFRATCLPLYNRNPIHPDVLARTILNLELAAHFFRGEAFTFDWLDDARKIRCPTLILAGTRDPITTVADAEDLAAAIPTARLRG